ncbi:aldehyde dehydrogenase family protein [Alishewanella longhuensis]
MRRTPALFFADADVKRTLSEVVSGALSFNGQRCTALKILFVERRIADRFVTELSAAVAKLPLGMPWDNGVAITPLPEPGKTAFLTELLQDAVAKGAAVQNPQGGETAGSLFRPAVLYPVNSQMRLYNEEQFGPLVPVVPFDHIDEVIDYVVNSNFGQQLSIFGQNARAGR